jgi:hypothetical protein
MNHGDQARLMQQAITQMGGQQTELQRASG